MRVTIIGGGPRCINIVEHLGLQARGRTVEIHVVDPRQPGQGVHFDDQYRYLLTNTLAGQVSGFCQDTDPDGAPRPSFLDWAREQGFRCRDDDVRQDASLEPLGELAYLPRWLLGSYLAYAFDRICRCLPPGVSVTHHPHRASEFLSDPQRVRLSNGHTVDADILVLATGHSGPAGTERCRKLKNFAAENRHLNPRLRYIANPYPTSKLDDIPSDACVGIQGMGLTAHDILSQLTRGRGGDFSRQNGQLIYHASGSEPSIVLYSRSGLPAAPRPVNQKGLTGQHTARFVTAANIRKLRQEQQAAGGSGKLDFEAGVMPLIRKEMALAYRLAAGGETAGAEFIPTAAETAAIDEIISPSVFEGIETEDAWQDAVVRWLHAEMDEAKQGNVRNPRKAASDCIREIRAGLCEAIEYGGLTGASHRWVLEQFVPMTNRITFGPPMLKVEQLLALYDAGILRFARASGAGISCDEAGAQFVLDRRFASRSQPLHVDTLVMARIPHTRPDKSDDPFFQSLADAGMIRTFSNDGAVIGGIEIDRDARPISREGSAWTAARALGFAVEGSRFHTHALPRPGLPSTQAADAEQIVASIYQQMRKVEALAATPARTLADA